MEVIKDEDEGDEDQKTTRQMREQEEPDMQVVPLEEPGTEQAQESPPQLYQQVSMIPLEDQQEGPGETGLRFRRSWYSCRTRYTGEETGESEGSDRGEEIDKSWCGRNAQEVLIFFSIFLFSTVTVLIILCMV